MDHIRLLGVACAVRLGVPDQERRRPQKVLLDLDLEADLAAAGDSDDFRLAVDYWSVESVAREGAEARPWRLLEALAEATAALILTKFPAVAAVSVTARKKPAVMPKTREVVVEILRRRD